MPVWGVVLSEPGQPLFCFASSIAHVRRTRESVSLSVIPLSRHRDESGDGSCLCSSSRSPVILDGHGFQLLMRSWNPHQTGQTKRDPWACSVVKRHGSRASHKRPGDSLSTDAREMQSGLARKVFPSAQDGSKCSGVRAHLAHPTDICTGRTGGESLVPSWRSAAPAHSMRTLSTGYQRGHPRIITRRCPFHRLTATTCRKAATDLCRAMEGLLHECRLDLAGIG